MPSVLFCVLLWPALVVAQEAPKPIRWSAVESRVAARPGQTVVVQVAAVIDEGWHLYALDPIEGGPIPTKLGAGPAPTFSLIEKDIEKPEPKRAVDPNFNIETAYYEESAAFGLPIAVAKDAGSGERALEITARFQACNDHICLRPQTATIPVTVTIRP
jgi:DsbC/DsbD-like thiol-disulfide interchange protein